MKGFLLIITLLLNVAAYAQEGVNVTRHNHLAIHVRDLPTSVRFYSGVLGLESLAVPENLRAIRAWYDVGDGQQIHLLAGRTEPVNHDKNGSHFALFVGNIGRAERFLQRRNIEYIKQTRFDGVTQIYVADPDGYLFELNEGGRPERGLKKLASSAFKGLVDSILD